ncbi:MAG: hypothetical protein DMF63_15065 [Acidobacteria bacterium]|nr:MAG: hypothetical protein DMF63_15065 [Acidobacteriota bacterium]
MKRAQIFLVILFLGLSVSAQKPQLNTSAQRDLRRHIEYLASDKLEGRRTGDPGATEAANYIVEQFKKTGKLRPGQQTTHGASYLQGFPYISGVELGTGNSLSLGSGNTMQVGVNWMPLGYSPNADIAATQVVFAGFGVTAPEANYDDYKDLDVRDKIVLVFDNTPDAGNPHSAFARFDMHTKANIAKDRGARAIILIAADNDFKIDRLSRLSYDRTLGETAIPVIGINRDLAARLFGMVDGTGLALIESMLNAKTPSGSYKAGPKTNVLDNTKAQIKINLTKKQVNAFNVIGVLEGSDPQLKNEAIIIGAHYDHLGHGGSGSLAANSTEIHHGADDNASGTTAVIELARLFSKERRPKRTLIFMTFAGEEEGLLGSKYYVNNPAWPLDKTVAMINLDMVGRLNENKLTIGGIGTATEWSDMITNANNPTVAFGPPSALFGGGPASKKMIEPNSSLFQLALNQDGFGPSDHSSFYGKKIPVLFFFTGTHVDYHKPSDTADKINYLGLQRIILFVGDVARSLAQAPAKPTYAVAQSSGPVGQVRLSVSLGTIPSYGDTTDGMILDGVRDNSPASKAGLKAGDKIVKLAGKDVRNAMDYTYVLGSMKPGEEYEVELIRGTERMTLKIIPAPSARRP